jgi:mono/diheme cytochrome c family protein
MKIGLVSTIAKNARPGRWLVVVTLIVTFAIGVRYHELLTAAVTPNPTPPSPESINRGRELWRQNCEACHGASGRGDGPISANLQKQPKDLSKIAPSPVFPDGVVAYRIANGGEVMPAWKGVLSTEQIWDLINFIRTLKR